MNAAPKTVLITGDAGFIGAHLSAALKAAGHRVVGYDKRHARDLLDAEAIENEVASADVVFHLAAQPDLNQMAGSMAAAREGVSDNVLATHNVAHACAKHSVRLIHASTVAVYGALSEAFSSEDDGLPAPAEIYACSKYASEALVIGYGRSFGMPWTILRIATVYGPKMRSGLGLDIFFRQAIAGEPITLHGDGSQERVPVFVKDLVDGMIRTLDRPDQTLGETINLAGAERISARMMAEDVVRVTGSNSNIINLPQRKNQIMRERVDIAKARELLGWKPATRWVVGLEQTYRSMLGD